jgi:hypothetical protein
MSFLNTVFKRKFIQRAYRFGIEEHHDISVAIDGDIFEVENISTSGICLRSEILCKKFKNIKETVISLRLNNQIFIVSGEVARASRDQIAFAVSSDFPNFKTEVRTYFNNEMKSIKIVKKDIEELHYEGPGEIHWYFGDKFHEIFYVVNDGVLEAFWINCRNIIFESSPETGFKSFLFSNHNQGLNEEFGDSSGFSHDATLYEEMIPFVLKFVEEISVLDKDLKSNIVKVISAGVIS